MASWNAWSLTTADATTPQSATRSIARCAADEEMEEPGRRIRDAAQVTASIVWLRGVRPGSAGTRLSWLTLATVYPMTLLSTSDTATASSASPSMDLTCTPGRISDTFLSTPPTMSEPTFSSTSASPQSNVAFGSARWIAFTASMIASRTVEPSSRISLFVAAPILYESQSVKMPVENSSLTCFSSQSCMARRVVPFANRSLPVDVQASALMNVGHS